MIAAIIIFFLCFIASQTLLVFMPYATTAAMPLSSETDKLALLALKVKLTNGNHDNNALPSWNESLHFCEWQGVTCSRRHKRVSALQLQNQDLGGTLGPTLGNLTFLKKLNLTNVNLYGEIPREVGRLKRLQILCLDMNNVHGEVPMEITNCSKLEVVFLTHNNLTGKVPSWFGSMVHLTWLQLGANNLVGRIPPSLGNLSSLETLSLAYNHLEGNIPHILEYGAGGSVSAEGDMYSYGILLLEMITGKKPTDSIFGEGLSLHLFCNMAILEGISEIVDSRLLIPITEQEGRRVTRQQNMEDTIRECLVSFTRIGIACSEKVPSQRMGIKDVIMELHAIKQKLLS